MKHTLTLLVTLLISISSFAQTGINYKAVIKDNLGNVVAGQTIDVRFTIIVDGGAGDYIEKHTITTNANGLLIANIGEGSTVISGDFATTNWTNNVNLLKTEIDIERDGTFVNLGTTSFKFVPYAIQALRASEADNAATKIDDLTDGKSFDFSSSIYLGLDAGLNDDGSFILNNLGIGSGSLKNTEGNNNTAIGYRTLYLNTTGHSNTAIGYNTLFLNNTGNHNTAIGLSALSGSTIGNDNTAIGSSALQQNNSGNKNTASGRYALSSNATGNENTANGYFALGLNTTGNYNTATGSEALRSNTTGYNNTANGYRALYSNTTGFWNTANGYTALYSNTTGFSNTANGIRALYSNTTGDSNTANGIDTMYSNTTGSENTATGRAALFFNTTGENNTANGHNALERNTTGSWNTATGNDALYSNTIGIRNTAIGNETLNKNTTGSWNTATGNEALYSNTTGELNVATGNLALRSNTTGIRNTAVGYRALFNNTTGSNNIAIGNSADVPNATSSNQIRIGNTSIQSATTQVAWTFPSDKRWKENIRELPYGLDLVKQLKPVDYIRKNNTARTRDMGFIAQDLEALLAQVGYTDQGFLTKDDDGYLSVRYNDLIALLTKAIQEQQDIIESQNLKIDTQSKNFEALLSRVEALETNK